MDIWMIALLVGAALVGNLLMVAALRKGRQVESGLQTLAQSNGWQYDKVKSTSRVQGHIELADGQAGWSLRLYSGGGEGRGSHTIWTDPSLAIPSGLAVYAAPLPDKTQMMINLMMDKAGGLGRVMLDSLFKGLGPAAKELRTIDDDDPATLMATPGAEAAFDPLKGAEELQALNQFGKNIADVPFLVRNADGLSMRINKRLKDADEIERFIGVAKTLAARIQP